MNATTTGIVAFAFGSPSTIRANRVIAVVRDAKTACLGAAGENPEQGAHMLALVVAVAIVAILAAITELFDL